MSAGNVPLSPAILFAGQQVANAYFFFISVKGLEIRKDRVKSRSKEGGYPTTLQLDFGQS